MIRDETSEPIVASVSDTAPPRRDRWRSRLPTLTRIVAGVVAGLLFVIGLAGLILPGIQGVLTLALSMTLFSLVSDRAHRLLRTWFRPWPGGWRRVLRVRRRVERWISPSLRRR